VKIARNAKIETRILDQIKVSFTSKDEERNATLHLSDLLNPRKAFWQRTMPLPLTTAEVLYFLAGRGHEDAFGRIAGMEPAEQRVWYGISYRPDFLMYKLVPGEFKTRRSNLAEPGEELVEYENYLEQLGGYCAVEDSQYGLLFVVSLLEGRGRDPLKPTEPVLACYDVVFTPEELETRRQQLGERKVWLEAALKAAANGVPDSHIALPLCKDWMCGKPLKVVDKVAFCRACKKEINHRAEHQHVQDGLVEAEQIHWEYQARCKWHANCRPWEVDPTRGAR
jgi:hypothetical protein